MAARPPSLGPVRGTVGTTVAALASALVLALAAPAVPASAQTGDGLRPHADWRTVHTESFRVHYPAEAERWILPLVARMEAMHEEVAALVGRSPDRRVTVIVTDPINQANGFAIALMDDPLTVLWPTPPGPRAGIGEHRGWGELLFIHEYAHLAHLTFPSRNPRERFLWSLLPVRMGPVTRRSPRWVIEGYATFVEGRLTGSGRPHGASRPAYLRARALEGRLPTYGRLSAGPDFHDMAAAYLAGSSYLEWLAEREGDESLNHLWRRMSAREQRGFPDAFSGVFRGPPDELYGRFTVEVTEKALRARDLLEEAGLEEGELWQLRRWSTGEPALSPDGSRMAVVLFQREGPDPLVVWDTEPDEEAIERREEARERLLERDPLDVPAVDWRPPPRREVARLDPVRGRPYRFPRFLPDGERILAVRWDPVGDGTLRPDLFVWHVEEGTVRRVTEGAAIRWADPSPDGREAAGLRCEWGSCDVVRVDLETGAWEVLVPGSPEIVHYRPRWAPDGGSILFSVQEADRWRLASVALEGPEPGTRRFVDPEDGANRYDAAFLPDGRVVAVSDLGGVPNLEILDPATREVRPLTRVLGETAAPEPDPATGWIHFLSMHSRGWDLRRVHPDSVTLDRVVGLPEELWPVARWVPPVAPDTFPAAPVPEVRPYGWGRQRWALLPAGGRDAGGGAFHLALASSDPIGRLGLLAQGAFGDPEAWTGGSVHAVARRFRPFDVRAEAFLASRHPSGSRERAAPGDARLEGGLLLLEDERELTAGRASFRLAGSAGRIREAEAGRATRVLAAAEGEAALRQERGRLFLAQTLRVHGALGRTAGEGWDRARVDFGLAAGSGPRALVLDATWGRFDGEAPFEAFQVGGERPLLFDPVVFRQQAAMPALPPLLFAGERIGTARAALRFGNWEPYLWLGSVDRDLSRWHRVAGLEARLGFDEQPLVGLPGLSARIGAAHSFDEPFEGRWRGYFSVGLRP